MVYYIILSDGGETMEGRMEGSGRMVGVGGGAWEGCVGGVCVWGGVQLLQPSIFLRL